jgi:predicted GNAT family acetyltransferase
VALAGEHAPLDRSMWMALTTRHRHFAQGDDRARRYPPQIGPLAAIADTSAESLASLKRVLATGDPIFLTGVEEAMLPGGIEVIGRMQVDQMVAARDIAPDSTARHLPLGEADAPEMLALAQMTKPGPFEARTHELGRFIGIRVNGQLAAMAGERMHLDGYREVSAVCCHPDHRGHGYARDLMVDVMHAIFARGERPFLHVLSDNHPAIALYDKLGFVRRMSFELLVLRDAVVQRRQSDAL